MPKIKTHRGAAKRFNLTKNGKVKSTLMVNTFSLSVLFVAVYVLCFMLLNEWLDFKLAEHLPTWLVSEHLLRGELIPLFCEGGLPDPEPSSIYALNLNRDIHSRTRLLLAFLRERFGEAPPWDRLLRERLAAERNEPGHFQAEF